MKFLMIVSYFLLDKKTFENIMICMKYKIIFLFFIVVFIASCGKGDDPDFINGISVPEKPDVSENNSTLAGIDSNSNGVRDDVERWAASISKDKDDYERKIISLRAYQGVLTSEPESKEVFFNLHRIIWCNADKSFIDSNDILPIMLNTDERKKVYRKNIAFGGAYMTSDFEPCEE